LTVPLLDDDGNPLTTDDDEVLTVENPGRHRLAVSVSSLLTVAVSG
jgi:hypothetical protein